MKKILRKILLFVLTVAVGLGTFAAAACASGEQEEGGNGGGNEQTPVSEGKTVSRIAYTEEGKAYLEVDGEPFTYAGAQIRIDGFMDEEHQSIDEMERYFKLAADMNVTMVELPIQWKDIEPEKDRYDFRNVGKLLGFAKKYGLKVELLLFTVNVCGMSAVAPDYINRDAETYPRYPSDLTDSTVAFYEQDNPNLLERESLAVDHLMSAVADWCDAAGENVVIAVQVHNEPDVFPLWRLQQYNVMTLDGSRRLTDIEAWEETLTALDVIGKVVKNSDYKVVTRVNTAIAWDAAWEAFVPDIYELEGIDIVGDDTYNETVAVNKEVMQNLSSGKLEGNLPHVAENRGSYTSAASCILAVFCMGGGYDIYDLITPKVFIRDWGWPDEGIIYSYDPNDPATSMKDKPHTELARRVLYGIKNAGYEMTLAPVGDIAGFNLAGNHPQTECEQTIDTTSVRIAFSTQEGALAFAIVRSGYVTLFSTHAATFTLSNGTFSGAQYGTYAADGSFTAAGAVPMEGNTVSLDGMQICRIKIDSSDGTLTSTAVENIA